MELSFNGAYNRKYTILMSTYSLSALDLHVGDIQVVPVLMAQDNQL